jgi:hypothetical protein
LIKTIFISFYVNMLSNKYLFYKLHVLFISYINLMRIIEFNFSILIINDVLRFYLHCVDSDRLLSSGVQNNLRAWIRQAEEKSPRKAVYKMANIHHLSEDLILCISDNRNNSLRNARIIDFQTLPLPPRKRCNPFVT